MIIALAAQDELKQALRAWYTYIDEYFQRNGRIKFPHEHALYVKKDASGDIIFICLYVDDLIFTGSNIKMFDEFKKKMV